MDQHDVILMEDDASLRCLPESCKVEESIEDALRLIQSYTDETNGWRQSPETTLQALNAARDEITNRWEILREKANTMGLNNVSSSASDQEIRVAFVDMITDAFGDMLQEMQHTGTTDIEALVDCLQSGLDMMNVNSIADLAWCIDEEEEECEEDAALAVTPHEQRRRTLGFAVEEASA